VRQDLPSKKRLVGQERQLDAEPPSHEAQLEWHGLQPVLVLYSLSLQSSGGAQVPSAGKYCSGAVQDVHWFARGPLHVRHVPSQRWQNGLDVCEHEPERNSFEAQDEAAVQAEHRRLEDGVGGVVS
jgi:hypothetical protein